MPRNGQVVRLLRVLRALELARDGLQFAELRGRLDDATRVTERTLHRDLQALEEAGLAHADAEHRWRPVQVPASGVALASPSEVLALLLASSALEPLAGTDLADELSALREKLLASLTPRGRVFVAELRGAYATGFSAPAVLDDAFEHVRVLEDALHKQQCVRLRYRNAAGEESLRTVRPYTLWFQDGQLYLLAHCALREEVRLFLCARILGAELLEETFEPDPAFDAREMMGGGFGVWCGAEQEVVLVFAQGLAHLPRERRFHATQRSETEADGSVRVSFRASGLPAMASWVAGFGGQVRVVEPAVLRDMVRELHVAGLEALGMKPRARAGRGAAERRRAQAEG